MEKSLPAQKYHQVHRGQEMAVVWHFHRMFSKQEEMFKIHRSRGRKRSRWLKVLAVKPDDPSSIPRTYMVEGEDGLPQIVLNST